VNVSAFNPGKLFTLSSMNSSPLSSKEAKLAHAVLMKAEVT